VLVLVLLEPPLKVPPVLELAPAPVELGFDVPLPDAVSLLHDVAARGLKSTAHTKAVATVRMASPRFVLGDCSIVQYLR